MNLDKLRKQDKLFILGFAPTTRHMAPFDDDTYDAWAVNEEYAYDWTQAEEDGNPTPNKLKREFQAWFQMHPRWDFMRENNANHYNHPNWLLNKKGQCLRCKGKGVSPKADGSGDATCPECKNGIYTPPPYRRSLPIIMQRKWDDIPNSMEYPLQDASKIFGLDYSYFTSSVSFMLTLAYLLGYKQVELYGFEMGTDTEYHYQRANAEFVIGFLMAKGMKIILPEVSRILKGDLYGYKNMRTGFRQNLEMRMKFLESHQEVKAQAKVQQIAGQVELLKELMKETKVDIHSLLEKKALEYDKAKGLHNIIKGAKAEVQNMTGLFDKFYMSGDNGNESIPSMEGFASFTNVEYENG